MLTSASLPVNYRIPDCSPAAIEKEADYAVKVAKNYARWIAAAQEKQRKPFSLERLEILELGPGQSLAPAVLLACAGAKVTVSDRFSARWHAPYHRAVYETLLRVVEEWQPGSGTPIIELLSNNAFVPSVVRVVECAAENLSQLPAGGFDVVISNAVLEHLEDVLAAFAGLAHVTRQGGASLHQVDFRDHRNFKMPLEYLTLSNSEFSVLFAECMGECGNRWRPGPMAKAFIGAGFRVERFSANMHAEDSYIESIKTRLHADVLPIQDEDLRFISGFFSAVRE